MNRIEIKADEPVEVHVNGIRLARLYQEPDPRMNVGWGRITITLTEREAVCVRDATAKVGGSSLTTFRGHADKISAALGSVGIRILDWVDPRKPLEGKVVAVSGVVNGNVGADRVLCLHTSDQVKLTMDRDVAVTLRHLLDCVIPLGELLPVAEKLVEGGAILGLGEPRFTGTIRWKKRKLSVLELEEGKTYRYCPTRYRDGETPMTGVAFEEVEE